MKFFYFVGILIVASACLYWFIPNVIVETIHVKGDCKIQTLRRLIHNQKKLIDSLDGINYSLVTDDFANPIIFFQINSKKIFVTLNNYQSNTGENMIIGSYSLNSENNSIEKIENFYINYKIKGQIRKIIQKIGLNCEKLTNTYGGEINQTNLMDSTLIYTKISTDSFPTVVEIYNTIRLLEKYASSKSAKITNYPMLHINKIDSTDLKYEISLALPIDKELPSFGNISPKRMLVGGKFLTTTVKGGFGNVANMEKNLEHYLSDYTYSSPAIPFQSLVTNRVVQKDSTQWVTILYYPIY